MSASFNKKGQAIIAGLLYFFMALVIVALFMPTVIESINENIPTLETALNGNLIGFIVRFWPVGLFFMMLIILVVISQR
jgi:hypothetical protein